MKKIKRLGGASGGLSHCGNGHGQRVRLVGRNLKMLWRYLLQESVTWIRELPLEMDDGEAAAVVVHRIELVSEPAAIEGR